MSFLSRTVSPALAVAACVVCCAADPPARPGKDQIAQWVKQLGDDDFSTREEASRNLYRAGQAAEEALQEAAAGDDAEVVRRARAILDKFKWGLFPDAPQNVVDLVNRYRGADRDGKQAVIKQLLDAGPAGYRTLCRIAGAEDDPTIRGDVYRQLRGELNRRGPQLILDENYDSLELLLDAVLANDPEEGIEDYAAYWLMRGKLDDRIAHYKALAAKGVDAEKNWELASHLLHAKGDLAGAREAADKAGKPELADAVLYEAGDWKALADRPVRGPSNLPYEDLGLKATYHRLAGDAKGFDEAVAQLRKDAAASGDEEQIFHLAKLLFLNDRPVDGLEVLAATPDKQVMVFEMLAAQMRYKEALETADRAQPGSADVDVLQILKARTLYTLGEKDKAAAIFASYGDRIKGAVNVSWPEALIEAENRVGLKEKAFEHAVLYLSTPQDDATPERLFEKLLPKNGETAGALWDVLRTAEPNQEPASAMKELRRLLDGTADPKTVADLADRVRGGLKFVQPDQADRAWRALAEAALLSKDEQLGRSLLEKNGSALALIRLGDLDAEKKEWDKAADDYRQAWEQDHFEVIALYLEGWALAQAGKDKEGKKLMEAAHWTPLGDGQVRAAFLRALEARGQREAVRRERGLLLRLSPAGSYNAVQGMREAAAAALEGDDYAAAAAGQERIMLRCLTGQVSFVQPAAYLGVPALVHRLRAQADTAAGKFDDAQKEVALGLEALPGNTYVPIELVPAWDRAGRKKEAQELFDRCIAVQEELCDAYPNCAWGHNSVAWISACCRRNLESAQVHALKAVALAPDSAGDLDTLAEVNFQRGDKEKAIAAQKKAIQLDPKKAYYRRQLKRIEAGDPAAQRPAEDDEE